MIKEKIVFLLILAVILSGCSEQVKTITDEQFALGTIIKYKLYIPENIDSENIISGCEEVVNSYENLFSRNITGSDIDNINNNPGNFVEVNNQTIELINLSIKWANISNGALDISIGPIVDLWDIGSGSEKVPSSSDLESKLKLVGWELIDIDGSSVQISNDMLLDLGAVAKGYIADKLVSYLQDSGVNSGILNLGGNIVMFGEKPDSSPFKIGLQNPFTQRGDYFGIVTIEEGSIVSSGTYERFFYEDNIKYHHIFDTNTGFPIENGVEMVTIISEDSTRADILSTTLFALGINNGLKLVETINGCEALFIDSDSKLYPSSGFLNYFELTNKDFTISEDM